ncbi:MAG: histidine--tRNA ligase [Thermoplasmata archaeon]|nr:MAG: histidine--tRNA ligase [Thermoplasmata archaeon]
MASIQRPRGTRDFGPEEMGKRRYIEGILRKTAETFGYQEITTPTFEHSELYTERSGEAIKNEMYMFKDKGGRELSLRPELTLPTMRFYANDMRNVPKPIKVYYFGNCFRYERPQSGRFREFWQYGAEIIGGGVYESDADIIALAAVSLENAGLKGFVTRIGHLGVLRAMLWEIGVDGEKQSKCMQLIDKGEHDELFTLLSEQSPGNLGIDRIRSLLDLEKSPSVLEKAKKILRGNRKALKAIEDLEKILIDLEALGVKNYTIDLGIARGLDYYTGMVFEIDYPKLGAEKQVCGGGAYTLAELFGSEPTTSTGFAIGFDRVMMALERQETDIPIQGVTAYVIPLGSEAKNQAFKIAATLRKSGISASIALLDRNISKHMKYANAIGAKQVIIIGEDELATKQATIKDMKSGEQKKVAFEKIAEHIKTASGA